ncbi:hypothetical protein [Cellulomonas sp. PhB143]|uniref:hypothetical protein n=1 Tax=Cellulomonas sp. PhB143 TaxID=2485186 RepID=UPI000FA1002C|nr:hypothetical protein [Cellulomonas sp. PhB143]ROS78732.1 hypothetical protein EDF32_0639 [Cellulomonas sp. PhB143]
MRRRSRDVVRRERPPEPSRGDPAREEVGPAPDDDGLRPTLLDMALARAVTIPSAAIHRHVDQVRRRNPEASPARIVALLEREYLTVVAATGGAVGVAAAIPAVGTGAGLLLTGSDVATFFGASAAFALAVADVHGIAVDDAERRRVLLLVSVLGERSAKDVERAAGGSPVAWGKVLMTSMPRGTLRKVDRALKSRFLRTQLAKQSGLALGRVVPFGVGAVVGVLGGRALGRGVVHQTRRAFGAPPERFARVVEIKGGADDAALPSAPPPGIEPGGRGAAGTPEAPLRWEPPR